MAWCRHRARLARRARSVGGLGLLSSARPRLDLVRLRSCRPRWCRAASSRRSRRRVAKLEPLGVGAAAGLSPQLLGLCVVAPIQSRAFSAPCAATSLCWRRGSVLDGWPPFTRPLHRRRRCRLVCFGRNRETVLVDALAAGALVGDGLIAGGARRLPSSPPSITLFLDGELSCALRNVCCFLAGICLLLSLVAGERQPPRRWGCGSCLSHAYADASVTFVASGPFAPSAGSNSTFAFSASDL